MRLFMVMLLVTVGAQASPNTPKKSTSLTKSESMKKDPSKNKEPNALDKKATDCDDKAKKPVDITPESISLSGNAGCSLDEAHP